MSYHYRTTDEAYLGTLNLLLHSPDYIIETRGQACSELVNHMFVVHNPSYSSLCTRSQKRNEIMRKYLLAEHALYMSGELRASVWAERASRFWGTLANADGTINSNYGWLVLYNTSLPGNRTPWEWARESLKRDPGTRQAYVRFALPCHQFDENKDQVCTMHMMFMRRQGKLHATTVMRSNDVVKGLAYDMPWFCYLLAKMSAELDIPVGTYTHMAHSLHLYERDRKVAEEMVTCPLE